MADEGKPIWIFLRTIGMKSWENSETPQSLCEQSCEKSACKLLTLGWLGKDPWCLKFGQIQVTGENEASLMLSCRSDVCCATLLLAE
jgi:hypothetical protein